MLKSVSNTILYYYYWYNKMACIIRKVFSITFAYKLGTTSLIVIHEIFSLIHFFLMLPSWHLNARLDSDSDSTLFSLCRVQMCLEI